MRRRRTRSFRIAVILGLIMGLFFSTTVKAEEVRKGYGYKDGKLYYLELDSTKATILDAKDIQGDSLPGSKEDRYVIQRMTPQGEYKYFFIDKTGTKIGKEYDYMGHFREGLAIVGEGKGDGIQYGVIDRNGKEIVPTKYLYARDFHRGYAVVGNGTIEDMKFGLIDRNGKEVLPLKYESIRDFNEHGLAIVSIYKDERYYYGLMNESMQYVLEPKYSYLFELYDSNLFQVNAGDWKNPKYGYYSKKGEKIVEPEYNVLEINSTYKWIKLGKDSAEGLDNASSYGMIDFEGNVLVPFDAKYIGSLTEERFFVLKDIDGESKFAMYHADGTQMTDFIYTTYDNFDGEIARVSKGKNYTDWGLIDRNGKEVVTCDKDYIFPFSEGLATFKNSNGDIGVLNKKGKVVLNFGKKYEMIENFTEGLCPVKKNGKYGYINKKGKLVVPCKFEEVDVFINGLARIYKTDSIGERKIGLINKKGKQVTPVQYSDIEYLVDSGTIKVAVKDSNHIPKYGLLDKKGKTILKPKYGNIYSFWKDVAIVSKTLYNGDLKFGLANKKGNLDKTIKFDQFYTPYKGMFKTVVNQKNGNTKNGMMDGKGREVLKPVYDEIENYVTNGTDFAIITNKSKKGLINAKGKIILPIKYEYVYIHEHGATFTEKKGSSHYKVGFMDKKGKMLIKPKYDSIFDFENGYAMVGINEKYGFIDTKGKLVIPVQYDSLFSYGVDKALIAGKDGKFGLLNWKGKTMLPFAYEELSWVTEDILFAKQKGKSGYLNAEGKKLIPIDFDYIYIQEPTTE